MEWGIAEVAEVAEVAEGSRARIAIRVAGEIFSIQIFETMTKQGG